LKIKLAVALIPAGVATGLAEAVIGRVVDIGSDGARSPHKHGRGARTADDGDVNAFAVI
jgi:hypothetical protein